LKAELILDPGAEISGLMVPFREGPTLLKEERPSSLVVDPTAITSGWSPGLNRENRKLSHVEYKTIILFRN
jgi:hypothetical protein